MASDGLSHQVIKSYLPSWEPGPRDLNEWVSRHAIQVASTPRDKLAPVELLQQDISRVALRRRYAQSNCFVLPTRGEGWGLPIAEAMAMGLPVIATNFSGPTAFLTAHNSHPLPVARELAGGFAETSVAMLRRAMRRAYDEATSGGGTTAKERGARARATMVEHFSRGAVADVVLRRLQLLSLAPSRSLYGEIPPPPPRWTSAVSSAVPPADELRRKRRLHGHAHKGAHTRRVGAGRGTGPGELRE